MQKVVSFLSFIDIFTYIPKPQAYAISTTKSKITTIVLVLVYLAYASY